MSLVNDMLRDLEQRRAAEPAVEISWINRETSASGGKKIVFAMLMLALIAIALAWLWNTGFLQINSAQNTVQIPAASSPAAETVDTNRQIDSTIKNESAEKTAATTSDNPDYQLAKDQLSQGSVDITETANAQLTTLDSNYINDGLTLTLQFSAPVSYQSETRSNLLRLRFASVQQSAAVVLPEIPSELAILQLLDEGEELLLTLQTRNAASYQLRRIDNKTLLITLTGLSITNFRAADQPQINEPVKPAADSANDSVKIDTQPAPLAAVSDPKRERQLTPQQQDQQAARSAQQQLRNNQRAIAKTTLQNYLAQFPQFARQSGHLLVSIMLEEGESSAAMNLLKQLRRAIPDDIALRQLQAQILIAENKTAEALQLLQQLSPVIREYPSYYEVMAAAAQKSANYPLAIQTYQRLLLTDSRRGDWWAGMAIALDASQQSQRASEAFRKALADTRLAPALRQYSRQRLGQPASSSTNPLSNQ